MKVLKRFFLVTIVILMAAMSAITAFAETIYIVDGYSYSISDNTYISLEDWDTTVNTTLTLPDSLVNRYFNNISNWAFENRKDLKGLDLSQAIHLKRIGYETFLNCSEIATDLVIPESVTQLNERSFSGCSSIKSIEIIGNVSVIPKECFYNNASAKTVVLPESVQSIEPWAFGNCTHLEYVELPKGINKIASSSFKNDPNLVLGVYKDTYALQYAEENQIDHIIIDGDKTGDVNGDGVVDILDATEIQKYAAEKIDFTAEQFELGDINDDGYCDVIDALLVQKSVIGAYELPQNIIRY